MSPAEVLPCGVVKRKFSDVHLTYLTKVHSYLDKTPTHTLALYTSVHQHNPLTS